MTDDKLEKELQAKINNVDKLLPYPKSLKKNLINNYVQDINEEINESNKIPSDLLINPRKVAEQLAKSQEWPIKNASLTKRFLAFIIDLPFSLMIGLIIWILFYQVLVLYDRNFFTTTRATPIALTLFIIQISIWLYGFLFYPLLFEGLFSTTIGKMLVGIIVIDDNGLKITWTQALIRSITKLFPLLLLFETLVGFYQMQGNKRIMDTVANTRVIEISKVSLEDEYIRYVVKKIPNHKKDLVVPLQHLKNELLEILQDKGNKSPYEIYGSPEIVAKSIVQSNNFNQKDGHLLFRTIAYMIDFILSAFIGIILMVIPTGFITSLDPNYFMYLTDLVKFLVFLAVVSIPLYTIIFYPILFEGYYSRTIGKWLFGLWTIDESGIKISWNQAVIRSLTKIIPIMLLIEVFYMFRDKTDKRRFLDKIASTRVVKFTSKK